jgi:hypothetical protein
MRKLEKVAGIGMNKSVVTDHQALCTVVNAV